VSNTTENVRWLTQEQFDKLKGELDHLAGPGRADLAKKIEAARDEGDLKENGGYHAAKEEQGKQEARIRQLQELLRTAKVGDAPTASGVAGPGMVVTVRFDDDDDETETFLIGSREETASDLEVYSAASPLGKALDGAKEGETRTYETPTGKTMSVTLLKAEPFHN
jgi:transcription elongation factor GreA